MKNENKGIHHLMNSTFNSWKGLKATFVHEAAFRQEIVMVAILFPLSFFVAESLTMWLILVGPLFLLLIVELLNSAIESVVDRVGSEYHELSGRAKDMGSAAVFINLLFIACVWGVTIIDRFVVNII